MEANFERIVKALKAPNLNLRA